MIGIAFAQDGGQMPCGQPFRQRVGQLCHDAGRQVTAKEVVGALGIPDERRKPGLMGYASVDSQGDFLGQGGDPLGRVDPLARQVLGAETRRRGERSRQFRKSCGSGRRIGRETESTVSRARERAGLDGQATRAEPGSFGKSPSFPQFLGQLRSRPHAPASESIAAMGNAGRPPIPLRRNQEEEKRKSASCPAAGQDGGRRRQPTRETNRETIDAMTLLLHAPLRKRSGRLIPPGLGGTGSRQALPAIASQEASTSLPCDVLPRSERTSGGRRERYAPAIDSRKPSLPQRRDDAGAPLLNRRPRRRLPGRRLRQRSALRGV